MIGCPLIIASIEQDRTPGTSYRANETPSGVAFVLSAGVDLSSSYTNCRRSPRLISLPSLRSESSTSSYLCISAVIVPPPSILSPFLSRPHQQSHKNNLGFFMITCQCNRFFAILRRGKGLGETVYRRTTPLQATS